MLANINVKIFALFYISINWIDLDLFRSF